MPKKTINLLIQKHQQKNLLGKIFKFTPIVSVCALLLFLLFYSVSVILLKTNYKEYNTLQDSIEQLEAKIASKKNTEGLYISTKTVLGIIEKILGEKYHYSYVLPEIYSLNTYNTVISDATIDKKGQVTLSVVNSSIDIMEEFVEKLKEKEISDKFSQIYAQGIVRDKNGEFTMTVTFVTKGVKL